MRKLKLLTLLTVSLPGYVLAQNYDFNQFKYRFSKNRGLNTDFSMDGYSEYRQDAREDSVSSSKNKSPLSKFNGYAGMQYFQNINSERLQQSLYFALSLSSQSNASKQAMEYNSLLFSSTSELQNQSASRFLATSFGSESRYYRPKGSFIYLQYFVSLQEGRNPSSNSNYSSQGVNESSNTISQYSIRNYNLGFGFGKGRLEYVTDAIQTSFLIKDLQRKAGLGEISGVQLENIARGVSEIRNKRFTDFRFSMIGQLEMLDSVLRANGVDCREGISYFTTINDNWQFATRLNRYSGSRWTYAIVSKGGLQKSASLNNHPNIVTDNNSKDMSISNGLMIEYQNSTQKSLKVQVRHGLVFTCNQLMVLENDKIDVYDTTNAMQTVERRVENSNVVAELSYNYAYLFQPNTRTFLNVSIGPKLYMYSVYDSKLNDMVSPDNKGFNQSVVGAAKYFRFVNARLTFEAEIIGSLQRMNSRNSMNVSQSQQIQNNLFFYMDFNMGLRYAFF